MGEAIHAFPVDGPIETNVIVEQRRIVGDQF